jgi:Tfp pilus assembly protein PilZ
MKVKDSDQQRNKNEERRKHLRKPCFIAVKGATWDSAFDGFIKNIGAGGVFFETPKAFAVGEEITLTFLYPGHEKPVKIVGEIVWNLPEGLAVKFKTADERLEAAIKALP